MGRRTPLSTPAPAQVRLMDALREVVNRLPEQRRRCLARQLRAGRQLQRIGCGVLDLRWHHGAQQQETVGHPSVCTGVDNGRQHARAPVTGAGGDLAGEGSGTG